MKSTISIVLFSFLLVLSCHISAFCQLIPVTLSQRINKASEVVEGKVISKSSFWNEEHTQIFTSNIISVFKIFKGDLTDSEVEVITPGGIVGDKMEMVTPSLRLNIGEVGILTLIPSSVKLLRTSENARLALHPPSAQFRAYAGPQGFIRFNLENHSASDPFNHYNSIFQDLYPSITRFTKSQITELRKPDYQIK